MYGELPLIQTSTGDHIPAFPIVIHNPPKTTCLRLPTSQELMTYLSSLRSLYRDLGRRRGESEDVPNPTADQKLFSLLRLDKSGTEFDDAEVAYALGQLTKHRVEKCERDGDHFTITLSTVFGLTSHTLRMPMQKEMMEYQRNVYKSRDLPHNLEERRFPPEVPAKLYDACVVAITGYASELNVATGTFDGKEEVRLDTLKSLVPPHHKRSVCGELANALLELDPQLDPNS